MLLGLNLVILSCHNIRHVHLHRCWFIFVLNALSSITADETEWTTVAMVLKQVLWKNRELCPGTVYVFFSVEAHAMVEVNLKEIVCILPT